MKHPNFRLWCFSVLLAFHSRGGYSACTKAQLQLLEQDLVSFAAVNCVQIITFNFAHSATDKTRAILTSILKTAFWSVLRKRNEHISDLCFSAPLVCISNSKYKSLVNSKAHAPKEKEFFYWDISHHPQLQKPHHALIDCRVSGHEAIVGTTEM